MELGRSLSSKRSSAGAELIPTGLTERQALALALEESRRAAQAAERAQLQDNSSDGSSGSEDESRAGARARKGGKDSMAKRKRQPAGAKSTGGQRKKARAVEAAEHKTGTSSENSKASRTTQQKMELGAAAGGSVTQAEGRECALGRHRGESADSEHRGGDSCDQNELNDGSKHSEDTHMKDSGSEGAGESGLEQQGQQQSVVSLASKLSRAGSVAQPVKDGPSQLDAHTVAEMARKRREKFGTSQTQKQRDKAAAVAAAAAKLRSTLSGNVKGQKLRVPMLDLGSRPSVAELVESDLFPDTPRRCSSSKTATPMSTPSLACEQACKQQQQQRQQQQAHAEGPAQADNGAAGAGTDPGASPVRTPSPMAGSPRSMQQSDTNDIDLSANDMCARLKELSSLVKTEDTEEGSALQEATPRESVAGGQEEPAIHEGSSKPQQAKQQQQQRRKVPPSGKRSPSKPARPPALTLQDSSEPGAAPVDLQQQKRSRGGSRAARTMGKNGPRKSRWTSPLSSPVGTSARRLRSAVVEEFKHNADAMDAFAWQPLTPSRQRTSAVLQACNMLSRQDSLALSLPSTPASALRSRSTSVKLESLLQDTRRSASAAEPVIVKEEQLGGSASCPLLSQPSLSTAGQPGSTLCLNLSAAGRTAEAADLAISDTCGFTTPPSSPGQQPSTDAFITPKPCETPLEFPTLAPVSVSTPVLATPAVTPPPSPAPQLNATGCSASQQATLPLWRKLRPLYLQEKQAEGGSAVEQPAGLLQQFPHQESPSSVASVAEELCAAIKGRHGLEGRRLELSSSAADDNEGLRSKLPSSKPTAAAVPYAGSRLGKALVALYGSVSGKPEGAAPGAVASFRHGCGSMLEPYSRARDAPAWKSCFMSRSGSAGSCSNNPHLARQRAQRNLQNTWDDLLARQALETATAEAMVAWSQSAAET